MFLAIDANKCQNNKNLMYHHLAFLNEITRNAGISPGSIVQKLVKVVTRGDSDNSEEE